jgi:hypothetical protein
MSLLDEAREGLTHLAYGPGASMVARLAARVDALETLCLEISVSGCLRFPGTDEMPVDEGVRLHDIVLAAGGGHGFEPLGLPFPRVEARDGPPTLKDHVKGHVAFQFYRDGNLWYTTETGLEFPVPIGDVGSATFLAYDKALLFMRYIRKHLEHVAEAQAAKDDPS